MSTTVHRATQVSEAPQPQRRAWRLPQGAGAAAALGLGLLLLIAAGYFLTWQLFYLSLPLESVSAVSEDVEQRDFRYDGVVYFRGHQLEPNEALALTYRPPWIISHGTPDLELFIERTEAPNGQELSPTTLVVAGEHIEGEVELTLSEQRLQRFTIDWQPEGVWAIGRAVRHVLRGGDRWGPDEQVEAALSITYADGSEEAPPINVATNVVNFRLYPYIFISMLGALVCFFVYYRWRYRPLSRIETIDLTRDEGRGRGVPVFNIVWMALFVLFAYWLHSGAFISNVVFEGGGRLSTHATHVGRLVNQGHLHESYYRESGFLIVPFLTTLVEGVQAGFHNFREFHPTGRYIVFAITALGIAFSALMIGRHLGRAYGVVFSFLAISFFPFMIDLYAPDADVYFVIIFPYILGVTLPVLMGHGRRRRAAWLLALAGLLFVAGTVKVNPVFLAVLIPLAMFIAGPLRPYVKSVSWLTLRVAILLAAFMAGHRVAETFQHPQRHVGIEGESFQETVFWHILWGSYGHYDHHSAHWFTRGGQLRNERVAERTGLPITTYLRQSQTATEQVYKPDVLQALRERPGFFYSTAFYRAYRDGIRFYRYTVGPSGRLQMWLEDGSRGNTSISGERVRQWAGERDAIRYGEAWKVSPLIFLAKLTLRDLTLIHDMALIVLALIGIFATRNRALIVFLLGVVAVQFAFSIGIHSMTRYFLFCSYALLVGLAVFGVNFVRVIIPSTGGAGTAPIERG